MQTWSFGTFKVPYIIANRFLYKFFKIGLDITNSIRCLSKITVLFFRSPIIRK